MRERALAVFALAGLVAGAVLWLVGEPHWADVAWGVGAGGGARPLGPRHGAEPPPWRRRRRRDRAHRDGRRARARRVARRRGRRADDVRRRRARGVGRRAGAARAPTPGRPRAAGRAPSPRRRASRRSPVEELEVGDVVVVRAGEVVPVDGVVEGAEAVVDESALTGEPLPVTLRAGSAGAIAARPTRANAFEVRVTRSAEESAYAAIVRLVARRRGASARRSRGWPTATPRSSCRSRSSSPGSPGLAAGDPTRGLAVLVVATPCPLILAAPIAFVGGLSRAARAGVIVKGAGVLERLGDARTVLLDKTGTLTHRRRPRSSASSRQGGLDADETLRLAASLDQLSAHVVAESLVRDGDGARAPARGADRRSRRIRAGHRGRRRRPPRRGRLGRLAREPRLRARQRRRAGATPTPARGARDPRRRRRRARRARSSCRIRLRAGAESLAAELRARSASGTSRSSPATGRWSPREVAASAGIDEVYAEQTPGATSSRSSSACAPSRPGRS